MMRPIGLVCLLACVYSWPPHDRPGGPDEFLALLESLQAGIEDFTCEYEGTLSFTERGLRASDLVFGKDGLHDTFSGTFVRRADGEASVDVYHRYEPDGRVVHERLVVHAERRQSESYSRDVDAPIGKGRVDDCEVLSTDQIGYYGQIFLLDTIRNLINRDDIETTLSSEMVDGVDLEVVSFAYSDADYAFERHWIDLARGGHVVRRELYGEGDLLSRSDIELKPFEIGAERIWMPVRGRITGHATIENGKIVLPDEPTSIEIIYVNAGTMEFNKRPAPEVFKIDYEPGTPISDNLKQLQYRFGQQRPEAATPLPTKAKAEADLLEQVAQAEKQRKELVAVPRRSSWTGWLTWAFGATTLALAVAVVLQRRR